MRKILVVDDDIDLLEIVTFFLRSKTYTIYPVSNWQEITEAIAIFQPDLILMDVSLNGADGRVICKHLKTSRITKEIPILLFSANYNIEQTLHHYSPDGFIPKPFENQNLLVAIDKLLFRPPEL